MATFKAFFMYTGRTADFGSTKDSLLPLNYAHRNHREYMNYIDLSEATSGRLSTKWQNGGWDQLELQLG